MKRIVIYHCFGGTHSSIIAANLHLGRLPWQNNVSASQLFSLPYFDQLDSKQAGLIYPTVQMKGQLGLLSWEKRRGRAC